MHEGLQYKQLASVSGAKKKGGGVRHQVQIQSFRQLSLHITFLFLDDVNTHLLDKISVEG